ncbi:helix-turn-helix domain-containing protein [Halalkalibacter alkalisediminis]|uniref:Helix-turn-helix domain-containing protein n=1 Tax=Halalkalibacter alkalisediminis TaxID=935616 RepID=A0ABV6NKW9_9BACI|nr:helix-turn-helix domain-containing protein [Halalkalibacter alkalisediminis]
MELEVGRKIRDLRKYYGMTQEELAEGICTQASISKIEKNDETYISAQILYLISQRLGVSIEYFFNDNEVLNISYVNEVCEQFSELIANKDYEEAYEMVKLEKNNPMFSTKRHLKKFLLWREALCINYLYGKKSEAIEMINEALLLSETTEKNYSLEDLNIMTSKAILLGELENWEESLNLYINILEHIKKIPFQKDRLTLINIYYNASRSAIKVNDYDQALLFCNKGILVCKQEKTFFLLGHLNYQKAECLINLNKQDKKMPLQFYKKALALFEGAEQEKYIDIVKEKINQLSPITK